MDHFFSLITSFTLLNALIFALIFFFGANRNKSLLVLGFFLIAYTSVNIQWIFKDVKYLPLSFSYLIVPLFYIYVKSVVGTYSKKDLYHLVVGLVEFLFLTIFLFRKDLGDLFYSKGNQLVLLVFFVLIPPLYNIFYCILSIRILAKSQKTVLTIFTETESKRLRWIYITCLIFALDYLLELFSMVGLYTTNFDRYLYVYQTITSCFIVYWVAVFGLNQKNLQFKMISDGEGYVSERNTILVSDTTKQEPEPNLAIEIEKEKNQFQMIENFFKETKIYRNKEVNLFMVADLLPFTYREVSKLINTYGSKNFNQFVNEFRIEEVKQLLVSNDLKKTTVASIGDDVGFNSKTSFFTVFRNSTGMTPLEYRNSKLMKTPDE